MPGVTVGDNDVVGAASVVTKDVAPDTRVAGNPAKFIKAIPPKLQCADTFFRGFENAFSDYEISFNKEEDDIIEDVLLKIQFYVS